MSVPDQLERDVAAILAIAPPSRGAARTRIAGLAAAGSLVALAGAAFLLAPLLDPEPPPVRIHVPARLDAPAAPTSAPASQSRRAHRLLAETSDLPEASFVPRRRTLAPSAAARATEEGAARIAPAGGSQQPDRETVTPRERDPVAPQAETATVLAGTVSSLPAQPAAAATENDEPPTQPADAGRRAHEALDAIRLLRRQ